MLAVTLRFNGTSCYDWQAAATKRSSVKRVEGTASGRASTDSIVNQKRWDVNPAELLKKLKYKMSHYLPKFVLTVGPPPGNLSLAVRLHRECPRFLPHQTRAKRL